MPVGGKYYIVLTINKLSSGNDPKDYFRDK
jgi:hypothetical protein